MIRAFAIATTLAFGIAHRDEIGYEHRTRPEQKPIKHIVMPDVQTLERLFFYRLPSDFRKRTNIAEKLAGKEVSAAGKILEAEIFHYCKSSSDPAECMMMSYVLQDGDDLRRLLQAHQCRRSNCLTEQDFKLWQGRSNA